MTCWGRLPCGGKGNQNSKCCGSITKGITGGTPVLRGEHLPIFTIGVAIPQEHQVKHRDASQRNGYVFVKRAMDVLVSGGLLVLGLPLWLLIMVAIKATSPGPALFAQWRVGLYGKPFRIYKFRSMVADAEALLGDLVDFNALDLPGFKIAGDPRVTPVGAVLRRTSLDEIPQLINVLKGEMSLVGPRPELPQLVEKYSPLQSRRFGVKPGMTGYQQVMARGVPLAAAIEYDLGYIERQCLLLDLSIMLKTIFVVASGKGVTH